MPDVVINGSMNRISNKEKEAPFWRMIFKTLISSCFLYKTNHVFLPFNYLRKINNF